jgi:hypothetical protein
MLVVPMAGGLAALVMLKPLRVETRISLREKICLASDVNAKNLARKT